MTSKKAHSLASGEEASNAKRVLYVDTDIASYVVKECYEYGGKDFDLENKKEFISDIRNWNLFMRNYEKEHNVKLPILTECFGTKEIDVNNNKIYTTVFSKAKGVSLKYIFDTLTGDFGQKQNQDLLTDQEAIDMGKAIGSQMGNLVKAFYDNKTTMLKHGDFGVQNFFYDKEDKQLYWIDLAGTEEIKNYKYYFEYLEGDISKQLCHIPNAFSKDYWENGRGTPTQDFIEKNGVESFRGHKKCILISKAVVESYLKVVKDLKPYKDSLKSNNDKLESIKYFENKLQKYIDSIYDNCGKYAEDLLKYILNTNDIPRRSIKQEPQPVQITCKPRKIYIG